MVGLGFGDRFPKWPLVDTLRLPHFEEPSPKKEVGEHKRG